MIYMRGVGGQIFGASGLLNVYSVKPRTIDGLSFNLTETDDNRKLTLLGNVFYGDLWVLTSSPFSSKI